MKIQPKHISIKIKMLFIYFIGIFLISCNSKKSDNTSEKATWKSTTVTATAYNSLNYQTGTGNPAVTAWGDTLIPGKKAIAISRDLLGKGLKHNTPVRIEGLEGIYFVKDKMHLRWKKRIDIYMGNNVKAAKNYGKRKVLIHFLPQAPLEKSNKSK